ncbi:MAG: hypothetical protein MZU97_00200 [Bacillus subtilis]|nr:hypothetical protein [Bacillus subtilis]
MTIIYKIGTLDGRKILPLDVFAPDIGERRIPKHGQGSAPTQRGHV